MTKLKVRLVLTAFKKSPKSSAKVANVFCFKPAERQFLPQQKYIFSQRNLPMRRLVFQFLHDSSAAGSATRPPHCAIKSQKPSTCWTLHGKWNCQRRKGKLVILPLMTDVRGTRCNLLPRILIKKGKYMRKGECETTGCLKDRKV